MNRSGRRPASATEREAAQRLVDSVMAESGRRGRDSLLPFSVMIALVTLVLLAVVLFFPALLFDDLLRGNGEGNVVDRLTRVLAFATPAAGFIVGLGWGSTAESASALICSVPAPSSPGYCSTGSRSISAGINCRPSPRCWAAS
ncbi:MAG: hypothetical protein M3Q03_07990 [Chloroflexota bacterium]|nr:hypothetical protein [Chloroflexota bacterium]